jgi:IclR family transcriptional regulator, acetate operon repressor
LKEHGVLSVAAAILSPQGLPIGAVAVAMPSVRATPEALASAGGMVRDAASEIATGLYGGRRGQT